MDENFEIDYWYPDDAHEGFQQWDEAGIDIEEVEECIAMSFQIIW